MNKKIYIIGPVGSGKTTLAKNLSKKYNIKYYELDKVVWDDDNNIKRNKEDIEILFNKIISNNSWIIEDIGRNIFTKGKNKADIIYYIKLSKIIAYYRVIKRWIKQRIGIESYNQIPNLEQLKYFIQVVDSYYKKEKFKLNSLEPYKDKVIYINNKDIKKLIKKYNN